MGRYFTRKARPLLKRSFLTLSCMSNFDLYPTLKVKDLFRPLFLLALAWLSPPLYNIISKGLCPETRVANDRNSKFIHLFVLTTLRMCFTMCSISVNLTFM